MALISFKKSEIDQKREDLEKLKGKISADTKLAEVEQQFSEGLTTLKDLLAPSSLSFTSSHYQFRVSIVCFYVYLPSGFWGGLKKA